VIPALNTVKTTVKIAARVKDNAVDIIAQPLVSADLEGLEHYNFFRYDPAHGGVFTANSDTPRQVIATTVKESSLVFVCTGPAKVGNAFRWVSSSGGFFTEWTVALLNVKIEFHRETAPPKRSARSGTPVPSLAVPPHDYGLSTVMHRAGCSPHPAFTSDR
jgi:hypothetical protein